MTPREPRVAVLAAIACIGLFASVLLLYPVVCATLLPFQAAGEGGEPGDVLSLGAFPESATALLAEPMSDEERLELLIAGASVPLLELSVEQVHALHTRDDAALQERAADLQALTASLYAGAAALEVSPGSEPARSHFIAALDEFAAAGALLGGGIPADRNVTDDALGRLATGTAHLSEALQDCRHLPTDGPDALPVLASLDEEPAPLFPDALQSGERFCYDDARKENSASLIVGPLTRSRTFQTSGTKPVQYTAESGKTYLLVTVRATHLGHRGNGINTRIQTPAESTFILHYDAGTYRPLASPGPTNKGASYSRVALGRGESVAGYLFFEVPEDLDPARAYLQATIGTESPVWLLGRSA
ncbi:DUF4352 domain-containing protein [Methanoculleus sp. Wushi-C6]|uniref:DUF4352 domain-containing protein n=1 Tax=Methanoculleus caldifontis TaxID=2651577 RepID=A0ABU3X4B9_9EURY|nr:hypothetical protein [Methanoculleus sp. Wushi-C6]MDV2482256.1 DUF4352 domain-containing protein [Methanoculleus sp. Wushi-C6]